MIRAEGEQRGGGTVIGDGPNVANCFDNFIRDVLCLDIPNPCFSVFLDMGKGGLVQTDCREEEGNILTHPHTVQFSHSSTTQST